jgi:exodeoxyribonuclease V alpha subunit
MGDTMENKKGSEILSEVLSPMDKHMLRFVKELQTDISENVENFLKMIFLLQGAGNTRFSLDAAVFNEKWMVLWNGLQTMSLESFNDFIPTIKTALQDIQKNKYTNMIEYREDNKETPDEAVTKPFVIHKNYIYITKYFDAKCIIERVANEIFKGGKAPENKSIQECIDYIASIHVKDSPFANAQNPEGKFLVNEEQAEAILRGQNENLIITGGPGTGKTTVVLYILWKWLASNHEFLDWNIRLAAPSGKAADRMRESLINGLNGIEESVRKGSGEKIYKKLSDLQSSTIHRLLKFIPTSGTFKYNKNNPFSENTLFVIDEASMIDISLFASFLQAVPKGAKVFILGDPFQLPSVGAGAVLGEILSQENKFSIKLKKSNRFNDESEIGQLAKAIQQNAETTNFQPVSMQEQESVKFIDILARTIKETENQVKTLVDEWLSDMQQLPILATQVKVDLKKDEVSESEVCKKLWNLSLKKRMLSAERKGPRGVDFLNRQAFKNMMRTEAARKHTDGKYFAGQLLILTQNQPMYQLYNGDTGIVVFSDNRPYLMLKKDKFVFYPLALLPADALESAFAITIHKSQGSEYEEILMFLPSQIGHPLLTNQIVYTGITRAKKKVTTVVSPEAFQAACSTVTKRETGVVL